MCFYSIYIILRQTFGQLSNFEPKSVLLMIQINIKHTRTYDELLLQYIQVYTQEEINKLLCRFLICYTYRFYLTHV